MKTHELKIVPEYFKQVFEGKKVAEIRLDDRGYVIGDELLLKEWLPLTQEFTGKEVSRKITAITWLSRVIPLSPTAMEEVHRWCVLHMGTP